MTEIEETGVEEIEFSEVGGLADDEIEDLAKDDPKLLFEAVLDTIDRLDDSDADAGTAPGQLDKSKMVTKPDPARLKAL